MGFFQEAARIPFSGSASKTCRACVLSRLERPLLLTVLDVASREGNLQLHPSHLPLSRTNISISRPHSLSPSHLPPRTSHLAPRSAQTIASATAAVLASICMGVPKI